VAVRAVRNVTGTAAYQKNSNKFGFSLDLHNLSPLVKVGCTSEIKINHNLFCISLDLHYLLPLMKVLSFDNKNKKMIICFVLFSLIRTFAPNY